jgi:DNA invertase Pin-like site-specific DNA recombinase
MIVLRDALDLRRFPVRCALYARVSTLDQQPENQLAELRRYAQARGWTAVDYVDHGVSGAKDSRPALESLVKDAKRRTFDVVVAWKLDRMGRNLKHLITLLDDLQALGVAFVSLGEGIDATTPAGKLQMHILGAIAEFERGRIVERVRAGLARAKAQGKKLGRQPYDIGAERFEAVAHLSLRDAATALGVSRSVVHRWRLSRKPLQNGVETAANCSGISTVAA